MSFLAPAALIAGLIAIPILLLYMLRLRRREVVVSSNFLWQQVLQDNEANTPWQRLRRNLLLILQLIILALLVLALMRPFITVPSISSGKTLLLLDASASMNATDVDGRSRFEAAQQEALEVVNSLTASDELSIIRVGDLATSLVPYTNDVNELRGAIQSAQPGYGKGDWESALTLVAADASTAENFNVILLTDGGMGDVERLPSNLPSPIVLTVGNSANNLAITALAIDSLPGQSPQLFAQVTNFGDAVAEVPLVIRFDGLLSESVTETIAPNSERSFVFEITQDFETVEAEILPSGNGAVDYLALDNIAHSVMGEIGTRRVLFMSEGDNLFLDQVLRSVPGIQMFRGDVTVNRLPQQPFDLYIFNGWLPEQLPDGDMLIINPPESSSLFTLGDEMDDITNLQIAQPDDARLAFVDVENVSIRAIHDVQDAGWAETLIRSDSQPILLAGEEDGRQIALLPFDVRDSDLPLQIAWPILISNLLEWFTPANILGDTTNLKVGDAVSVHVPDQVSLVMVTLPDGEIQEFPVESNQLIFTGTNLPGIYQVELTGGDEPQSVTFTIHGYDQQESNIAPVSENALNLGGDETQIDENQQLGFLEFWTIPVILLLIMLLIEWIVYHRRLQVPTVLRPQRGRTT